MKLYLYILVHPSFDGWVKLGRTSDLANRLNQYQTACPLRDFSYIYTKEVDKETMTSIERYFIANVTNKGFEWFNCSVDKAVFIVEEILNGNINIQDYSSAAKRERKLRKDHSKFLRHVEP